MFDWQASLRPPIPVYGARTRSTPLSLSPGLWKRFGQGTDRREPSVIRWTGKAIAAWFTPRAVLIAENLCLRQQLLVLERRTPRPRLGDSDGRFF